MNGRGGMPTKTDNTTRRQRGSSLVEYAVVFSLFMMMFLGVLDFGRALYTYHYLSNVARDATRWAAVNGADCTKDKSCDGQGYMNNGPADQAAISNYVINQLTPLGIDTNNVNVTANWPGDGTNTCAQTLNAPGCPVQVTVSDTLNFLFPFSKSLFPSGLKLSSSSQMIIAH